MGILRLLCLSGVLILVVILVNHNGEGIPSKLTEYHKELKGSKTKVSIHIKKSENIVTQPVLGKKTHKPSKPAKLKIRKTKSKYGKEKSSKDVLDKVTENEVVRSRSQPSHPSMTKNGSKTRNRNALNDIAKKLSLLATIQARIETGQLNISKDSTILIGAPLTPAQPTGSKSNSMEEATTTRVKETSAMNKSKGKSEALAQDYEIVKNILFGSSELTTESEAQGSTTSAAEGVSDEVTAQVPTDKVSNPTPEDAKNEAKNEVTTEAAGELETSRTDIDEGKTEFISVTNTTEDGIKESREEVSNEASSDGLTSDEISNETKTEVDENGGTALDRNETEEKDVASLEAYDSDNSKSEETSSAESESDESTESESDSHEKPSSSPHPATITASDDTSSSSVPLKGFTANIQKEIAADAGLLDEDATVQPEEAKTRPAMTDSDTSRDISLDEVVRYYYGLLFHTNPTPESLHPSLSVNKTISTSIPENSESSQGPFASAPSLVDNTVDLDIKVNEVNETEILPTAEALHSHNHHSGRMKHRDYREAYFLLQ